MERGRILIVEDEQLLALDLKGELEARGHVVAGIAASGETALSQFQPDQVDLALLDINLPGDCDGITLANSLRNRAPNLSIVFLTAYADAKFIERAAVSSPDGYLVKPFQPSELDAAISIALYKRRKVNGNGAQKHGDRLNGSRNRASLNHQAPPREIYDALSNSPLLSSLGPELLRDLACNTEIVSLANQAHLFLEGDQVSRSFAVLEGKIALLKTSVSGKELFTDIIFPGDPLGLVSMGDDLPAAFSARAQAASKVLVLPREQIRDFLNECEPFRRDFQEFLSRRLRASAEMTRALAHDRVEQRIAGLVLSIIERLPGSAQTKMPIWISLTRQELASMCGCTIETAIRVTRLMEVQGLLDLSHRRRITVLDPVRLLQVARSELQLNW